MKPRRLVALGLVAATLGCAGPSGESVDVLATFYPIAFVAEWLAAGDLRVGAFVPAHASPMWFEPAPHDLAIAARARLVLYNGEGIEPWLGLLERAAPQARLVAVTSGVTFLEDEGFPEDAGSRGNLERHDPHVWLDPLRMKRMVAASASALVELGLDPAAVEARSAALLDGLDALHERYDEGLAKCETRHLFVTRPAYGYLAVRYHLYQHGFSPLHSGAEASPWRLAREIELARSVGADAIFEDPHADPALAAVFAEELPGRVLALDTIEGIGADRRREGATYFSVMDANLARLRDGLRCG